MKHLNEKMLWQFIPEGSQGRRVFEHYRNVLFRNFCKDLRALFTPEFSRSTAKTIFNVDIEYMPIKATMRRFLDTILF